MSLQYSLSSHQFDSDLLLFTASNLELEVLDMILSPYLHSLQSFSHMRNSPFIMLSDVESLSLQSQNDEVSLVGLHSVILVFQVSSHSDSSGHHTLFSHYLLDLGRPG